VLKEIFPEHIFTVHSSNCANILYRLMHNRSKASVTVFTPQTRSGLQYFLFLAIIPGAIITALNFVDLAFTLTRTTEYTVWAALSLYWLAVAYRMVPFRDRLSIQNQTLIVHRGLFRKAFPRDEIRTHFAPWGAPDIKGTVVRISAPNVGLLDVAALNVLLENSQHIDHNLDLEFPLELPEDEFRSLLRWLPSAVIPVSIDNEQSVPPSPMGSSEAPIFRTHQESTFSTPVDYSVPRVFDLNKPTVWPFPHSSSLGILLVLGGCLILPGLLMQSDGVFTLLINAAILLVFGVLAYRWVSKQIRTHWTPRQKCPLLRLVLSDDRIELIDRRTNTRFTECNIRSVEIHYCDYQVNREDQHTDDILELHFPGIEALTIETTFQFEHPGTTRRLDTPAVYSLAPAYATALVEQLKDGKANTGDPAEQAEVSPAEDGAKEVVIPGQPQRKSRIASILVTVIFTLGVAFANYLVFGPKSAGTSPQDCTSEERFSEQFSTCRTVYDMACEQSPVCSKEGRCTSGGKGRDCTKDPNHCDQVCRNVQPQACQQSEHCQLLGKCSSMLGTGHCGIITDGDCAQSEACTKHGRCVVSNSQCVTPPLNLGDSSSD